MANGCATRVFLARHGETAWNREGVFRGTHDVPLNDNGREQARLLGQSLSRHHIDAAYSSPQSRAVETAKTALAGTAVQVATDDRLRDFCYGDWQTLAEAEVKRRWPTEYRAWSTDPQSLRVPGGSTLAEVSEVAFAAMEELTTRHAGGAIALFAHRVVNKLLVLAALGLSLDRFSFIRQDNCSVNEFERTKEGYIVITLNDTSHLQTEGVDLLCADF